jgi:pimeloyl-ACP methyl ester carboxylesterase
LVQVLPIARRFGDGHAGSRERGEGRLLHRRVAQRLLDGRQGVRRELDARGLGVGVDLLGARGTHDRRRDLGAAQHPRQRQFGHRQAGGVGDRPQAVDGLQDVGRRERMERNGVMAAGYVDTNGVRLWYEQLGRPDGAPVLLVMGGGASVVWWPPELLQGLVGAGYRAVQFDNRDTGLSTQVDWASAPYGIEDMAGDAMGVLDAVGIDAAHLVGVSVGGMICQAAALGYPDRVRSLTLISTTPGPDPRLSPSDEAVFAGLDRPIQTDADIAELEVDFCRAVAGSRFAFDEQYYRDIVAADLARGMNPAANAPSASSRIDQLARIQVPTLVVHGTEDPVYPYDHAEVLANGIPKATLVRWEGVGHEQPPQLVPELTRLVIQHIDAAS